MALKVKGHLINGMDIEEGYCKVTEYAVHTIAYEIQFNCALFLNEDARIDKAMPLIQNYCGGIMPYNPDDSNLVKQIYEYIKQRAGEGDINFIFLKDSEDI